eukprot:CAMPEP_0170740428 /NCGR_PEP_ID=MMETSP0437-20130122/5678_1 /TAXON_ID=0 /ORGANISM="Sexangularia sp." /LENGTH=60 /DNA_ID=CAMNT_0011078927 /DNA_START=81 /DNA_END=263 /DNA_ORIENTATION=+
MKVVEQKSAVAAQAMALVALASLAQPVRAEWGGADTASLIIGLILGTVCCCAFLGWVSRR